MVYQKDSRQDTLIKTKGKFIDETEQTVIASIKMMGANIEHSARNNYRPYLMLYGEISAVAFPNGRYQTFYPPTQTHVRYEFSDDELSQLVSKGLFYDGFKCPEIISDNPNIEIPMTALARRYLLMDNLYVTLDLASADIYKTDTQQCGYIFADYFETQIPSKLDTKALEPEEDVIPTFDDDFASQFADEFKEAGYGKSMDNAGDDFAKEAALATHQQSLITAEAQRLLKESPTAKRQRDIAEKAREKSKQNTVQLSKDTNTPDLQRNAEPEFNDILEDDDEFAAFRRAQKEFMQHHILPPSDDIAINKPDDKSDDIVVDKPQSVGEIQADSEGMTKEELEAELVKKRSAKSDANVNISVADNDDNTAEDRGKNTSVTDNVDEADDIDEDFGDAFDGALDDELAEPERKTKYDVEEALKNATSTKHNTNPQKLTAPSDSPAFSDDDFSMV